MPLGRGLGSLIPIKTIKKNTEEILVQTGEQVLEIRTDQIQANPKQPRENFPHLETEELINSIKEYGIIQPLILTKIGPDQYQIIAGERRWRAAKIIELTTVPSLIRSFEENDKLAISLLENIQRKDLNPMEKAKGYHRLMEEFSLTQEQVGQKMGKARASIANTLRLLTLPELIQKAIAQERITEGHAKALLSVDTEEKQKALLKRILGIGLTVSETEKIISGKRVRKNIELDSKFLEKEKALTEALGTKIKIIKQNKKIKIIIELYQDKELDNLVKKLLNL